MTPLSDGARALIDDLMAALQAKPDEARSFCIPNFNGAVRVVVHKGLPGGNLQVSRGLFDEVVQSGVLRKVEPYDKGNCLYELTEGAFETRSAASPSARAKHLGRRTVVIAVAVIGVAAAIVTILAWAGIGPTV